MNQPVNDDAWPFPSIPPEEFYALPEEVRAEIERVVAQMTMDMLDERKP